VSINRWIPGFLAIIGRSILIGYCARIYALIDATTTVPILRVILAIQFQIIAKLAISPMIFIEYQCETHQDRGVFLENTQKAQR